jgi:phenylpropionate dioxygenase-like ring-hydroxylating dioxygenase large terminal subunit
MNSRVAPEHADYQYGRSLPGPYYSDPEVFSRDLRALGATQWLLVDHTSRIPRPGDYFLFSLGSESLIVVRARDGAVHALYNVCRHRGSRICLEETGHLASLVCPYHAWSYSLDGSLRGAAAMRPDFDKSQYGLRRAHVRLESGFIFLNFATGAPPDFDAFAARLRPYLAPHRFESAKVAKRAVYPTAANWKLIVENFLECYHCKPAHPTYCSVHNADKILAFGAGPGSASPELAAKFSAKLQAWEDMANSKGFTTGMFADGFDSVSYQSVSRVPVGDGYLTESLGGTPVAPLMVSYGEYDYAQTAVTFNPLGHVIASSDHAVAFRFTPRGPSDTDVEALWLVRHDAVEGQDYDLRTLTQVWDITLREDKVITENNQAGIMSSQYSPGPHSEHETRISDFVAWYMHGTKNL